jgi:hypothetical protein
MHFDQNIIFIIIAAIVAISRLIARISEASKKQQKRQPPVPGRPRPEYTQTVKRRLPKTDEERVREFLEALGQPPGSAPPPTVQPRTQVPPRPLAPVQPPSSMRPFAQPEFRTWRKQAKEIVVVQQPTKPAPPPIRRVVPSAPPPLPLETNEPGAWMAQEQAQVAPAATKIAAPAAVDQPVHRATIETLWKNNLRSPDSLRTAIILREIFGPPRGLQPL